MVRNILRFVVCACLCGAASLHAAMEHRAVADFFYSDDTDNTRRQGFLLGYEHLFSEQQFAGVLVGVTKFHGEDAPVQDNDFNEVRLVGRKHLSPTTSLHGTLSQLDGDNWSPVLYSLALSSEPVKAWRIDLYTDRNVIETASAIAQQYTVDTYSITAEYALSARHILTAGIYQQDISDGNKRVGQLLQYTFRPDWFKKGYFKLRGKWRTADFDPVEYFSPEDFAQYHALIGYEAMLVQDKNLRLRAEVGAGRQYINNISEDAYEYLLGLRGWMASSLYLDAYYGCTTDGGIDSYEYCSARLVLNQLW